MTMLDKMGVSDEAQDQYAQQIAVEDICCDNDTDSQLLQSNNINIGEIL